MRNSASSQLNCRCNPSDGLAGASVVPNDFSGQIVGGVQIRTGHVHAAPRVSLPLARPAITPVSRLGLPRKFPFALGTPVR
jgi:hypothetical protein